MIDRNLDFTKSLSSKMQEQPGNQRSSSNMPQGYPTDAAGNPIAEPSTNAQGLPPRGLTSQSMEGGVGTATRRGPPPTRNDYDYIKMKNSSWGNKFDIISNKIKDFAK